MHRSVTALTLLAAAAANAAGPLPRAENGRMVLVHGCWGDEHGALEGGQFLVPSSLQRGVPEGLDAFGGRGLPVGKLLCKRQLVPKVA